MPAKGVIYNIHRREMAEKIPSLQDSSMSAVTSNLGKLAASVQCLFSCRGTIPEAENIVLTYKKVTGDWSSLELPAET